MSFLRRREGREKKEAIKNTANHRRYGHREREVERKYMQTKKDIVYNWVNKIRKDPLPILNEHE